jgi:tetratricopeptide (TPR) repeat protein
MATAEAAGDVILPTPFRQMQPVGRPWSRPRHGDKLSIANRSTKRGILSMAPDKKKIAADCFRRATQAMAKEDWDYAIEMLSQSVSLEPDNLMFRQNLRGCEYRKYGNNKTGARFSGPRLMGIRGMIKKARMQKNWEQVDQQAEAGLQINPWDAQLNADVADACRERGFEEVAVFAFEKAVEAEPNNKGYLLSLAELYEERGEYDKATGVWSRIAKLDPNDHEPKRKMTELHALKVTDRGGYDSAKSTKDVKAQPRTAYDEYRPVAGVREEAVAPGESLEADLQHAIRKDPNNKELYQKLADYYRREDRLDEAMAQFQKALEISGGDPAIREMLEDTELQRMRKNVEVAAEKLRAKPDDEALRQKAAALKTEFLKREIQVLQSRVERYPKDLQKKFELGARLMKFKKWDQAIPLLQAASANNKLEPEARVLLGECFLNDNKKPLATRQFETAAKLVNQHEQPDLFLKCHYVLGRLAEEKGDAEAAISHYTEVLSLDYNYRDARTRIDKLQGG